MTRVQGYKPSHLRSVMRGFMTARNIFKPGLWSHLANLENLPGLVIESLNWVPMADMLRIDLAYRGYSMQIMTDFELSPFLRADADVPVEIVNAVGDHMDACRIRGPFVVARMRAKYRQRREMPES